MKIFKFSFSIFRLSWYDFSLHIEKNIHLNYENKKYFRDYHLIECFYFLFAGMYEVTRQIIRLFTLGDDDDVILTGGKSKHNPDTRGVHSLALGVSTGT